MEKDGLTCPACLTLNPVGAPACVRCNGPLPTGAPVPPPMQHQPAQQQFLPQPRPQYVPPQQPPYAPAPPQMHVPPSQQPTSSGPAARLTPQRRRQRRRLLVVGNLVIVVGVAIAVLVLWRTRPHYLDTGVVAHTLAKRLDAKVSCPDHAKRTAGTSFTCHATYTNGHKATVQVHVTDDAGHYEWKVRAGH